MKKSNLFIILLLNLVIFSGCKTTICSSTCTDNISDYRKAEYVQKVYWMCKENPNSINENKKIWVTTYGEDIVNRGIELYYKSENSN